MRNYLIIKPHFLICLHRYTQKHTYTKAYIDRAHAKAINANEFMDIKERIM